MTPYPQRRRSRLRTRGRILLFPFNTSKYSLPHRCIFCNGFDSLSCHAITAYNPAHPLGAGPVHSGPFQALPAALCASLSSLSNLLHCCLSIPILACLCVACPSQSCQSSPVRYVPSLSVPVRGCQSVPFHSRPLTSMLLYFEPILPCLSYPNRSDPNQSMGRLSCRANPCASTLCRSSPFLPILSHPFLANPGSAFPAPPFRAVTLRSLPFRANPAITLRAEPIQSAPLLNHSCQSGSMRSPPIQSAPFLPLLIHAFPDETCPIRCGPIPYKSTSFNVKHSKSA